jgi:hypothetical protein
MTAMRSLDLPASLTDRLASVRAHKIRDRRPALGPGVDGRGSDTERVQRGPTRCRASSVPSQCGQGRSPRRALPERHEAAEACPRVPVIGRGAEESPRRRDSTTGGRREGWWPVARSVGGYQGHAPAAVQNPVTGGGGVGGAAIAAVPGARKTQPSLPDLIEPAGPPNGAVAEPKPLCRVGTLSRTLGSAQPMATVP